MPQQLSKLGTITQSKKGNVLERHHFPSITPDAQNTAQQLSCLAMAHVSVIVPAHNRDRDLRRALASVQRQSHADFECLVVDDASTVNISGIVSGLSDPRFRYIRRDTNGGPAAARRTAFAEMGGAYALSLDSDDELYPWALEQGVHHLAEHPEVDIVCALHVRHEDSRLFVRVERERVVTPSEFRKTEPVPDRVAMVRRNIIDLWLSLPGNYFALEGSLWITAALRHQSLALDEPWVRYHASGEDRVTVRMAGNAISRRITDYVTFLDERRDLIDCGPCVSVDRELEVIYFDLARARHPYAGRAAEALRSRGISPRGAVARQLRMRVRRKLGRSPEIRWA
jgi:glycosyltransferase involved in cell wall biosynthesis